MLQMQMYQLNRLLYDLNRPLYDHLDRMDISPTLYAAPSFLTVFASQLPIGFVARIFGLYLVTARHQPILLIYLLLLCLFLFRFAHVLWYGSYIPGFLSSYRSY